MKSTKKGGEKEDHRTIKTQTELSQQTIKTNKNIVKETQVEYSDTKMLYKNYEQNDSRNQNVPMD